MLDKLNCYLFGTLAWSCAALRGLDRQYCTPRLVITPMHSSYRMPGRFGEAVDVLAMEMGIPTVRWSRSNRGQIKSMIAGDKNAFILSADWRTRLPAELLDSAKRGAFNVHGSLLPAHRGTAPIPSAIHAGDTESGVTVHRMEQTYDTGAIVVQKRYPIESTDTAGAVFWRAITLVEHAVGELVRRLARHGIHDRPQDEARATQATRITDDFRRVRFTDEPRVILRLVRALSYPYAGASAIARNAEWRILAARESRQDHTGVCGDIVGWVDDGPIVRCGSSDEESGPALVLTEVRKPENGNLAFSELATIESFR